MERAAFRDEIKLRLTGNLLELELNDETIDMIINSALRELQRYICTTELITVPFSKCIDLSTVTNESGNNIKVSSVSRIYRAEGFNSDSTDSSNSTVAVDPLYASQ